MTATLLFILSICISIDISYFIIVFSSFHKKETFQNQPFQEKISVIIAAKNEAHNLKKNLPHILKQEKVDYEVIIVDDHSNDNTKEIIDSFEDARILYFRLGENRSGKKDALSFGIQHAQNEYLIFTDADCIPASEMWLFKVSTHFQNTPIVLGIGKLIKKNGLLNKLIRFDANQIALTYISHAKLGLPYMGVGRNMGYTKKIFSEVDGFQKHKDLASGDDDLFIQSLSNQSCSAITDPESFTLSKTQNTLAEWLHQKSRHISTSKRYKRRDLFLLSLYNLNRYVYLFSLLLISLVQKQFWWIIFGSLLIFILVRILFYYRPLKRLEELDIWLISPLLELMTLALYPYILFRGWSKGKKAWHKNLK
ncbi:MAG: glycosyltransferase [Flavobacteriales bacterium]|nr:glycosyltransferase [Flavobacteriales bacterium]